MKTIFLRKYMSIRLLVVLFSSLAAGSLLAQSGVDIFMSVGGAPSSMTASVQKAPTLARGDSTDVQYPGWIPLKSVSQSVSSNITIGGAGGSGASKPTFSPLIIAKGLDVNSPLFYHYLSMGKLIDYVTIDFRKSGSKQPFYRIEMQEVQLSSVSTAGDTSSVPNEGVEMKFANIIWSYNTGSKVVTHNYDLLTATGN